MEAGFQLCGLSGFRLVSVAAVPGRSTRMGLKTMNELVELSGHAQQRK